MNFCWFLHDITSTTIAPKLTKHRYFYTPASDRKGSTHFSSRLRAHKKYIALELVYWV